MMVLVVKGKDELGLSALLEVNSRYTIADMAIWPWPLGFQHQSRVSNVQDGFNCAHPKMTTCYTVTWAEGFAVLC